MSIGCPHYNILFTRRFSTRTAWCDLLLLYYGMDLEETVCVALLVYRRKQKKSKERRHWVNPINSEHLTKGYFYVNFADLRGNPNKFFKYFGMSVNSFEELYTRLRIHLIRKNTNMRVAITPEERLAVALRYLVSGCSFSALHMSYRIGTSTIASIVREVCSLVWTTLKGVCMPEPTEKDWLDISELFEKRANFPHCLGAVGGKHIKVMKPCGNVSSISSYKRSRSILLLGVADADYSFLAVNVGTYGQSYDPIVFKEWPLFKKLGEKRLQIPESATLPNDDSGLPMPYIFVADDPIGLSKNILKPFAKRNLTKSRKIFNYRIRRARRYLECTFGILANKWRIFHRPLDVKPDFADEIIKGCVVLHNFVRKRDGYQFEDTLTVPFAEVDFATMRATKTGIAARNYFTDYFTSSRGEVSWQYNRI